MLRTMNDSLQPQLRRGYQADLPTVQALLKDAGLPTDRAGLDPERMRVLVANDSVVGVIGLEAFGSEALLRSLVVAPGHRQHGFGHALVKQIEHEAQTSGVARLVLLTETATSFFRTMGYEVIDRS